MTAPIVELIGDTPLIRLKAASEATGCEIFGKAEFLNPGGSVKDRTALGLIRAAEADGSLRPGGVIVEGTAGNTGIGLALVVGEAESHPRIALGTHRELHPVARHDLPEADRGFGCLRERRHARQRPVDKPPDRAVA